MGYGMLRWSRAFLLVVLVSGCSPVRWTGPHVSLNDLKDIDTVLDEVSPLGESTQQLILTKDREGGGTIRAQVNTGREYLRLVVNDYYARATYDMACESFFIYDVSSLVHLSYARPSWKTYVADLRLDEIDPGKLPAWIFIWGPTPDHPVQFLSDLDPDFKVTSATATTITIIADETKHDLEILAWGDFDWDGVEDILLCHSYYSMIGTARSYGFEFLTRRSAESALLVSYPTSPRWERALSRLAAAPGDGHAPYSLPIRWTDQLAPGTYVSQLAQGGAEPGWFVDDLLPPDSSVLMVYDERKVTVTSLQEYYRLTLEGYRPEIPDNASFQTNGSFVRYVYPQLYLRQATSAKKSFLTEFALSEDLLEDAPPSLGLFACPAEEADRVDGIESTGGTWADAYPEDRVEVHSAHYATVNGRGGRVVIRLLAWGDFDGDGIEDVLLWLWQDSTEGTYVNYAVVALTRRGPDERMEVCAWAPFLPRRPVRAASYGFFGNNTSCKEMSSSPLRASLRAFMRLPWAVFFDSCSRCRAGVSFDGIEAGPQHPVTEANPTKAAKATAAACSTAPCKYSPSCLWFA